jgi:replicative DNA helicase
MTDGRHSKLRDDDAERAFVGSILLDPRRMADVAQVVRPEHFFDRLYRAVYEAALELHARQSLIEVVQILRMVRERRDVAMTESAAEHMADAGVFVDHITQSTVTGAHAVYYARLVAQTGLRREIASKASTLNDATDTERHAGFEEIMAMESELSFLDNDAAGPKLLNEECLRVLGTLATDKPNLIELGLPGLDDAIGGGAAPGEMVVIGARPTHGKTMCAMQILEHCATRRLPGLVISEEMSASLLAGRSLLHQTRVASEQWKNRMAQILADSKRFFSSRSPIVIAEPCGTVRAAVAQIDKAAASGVKVVVVDYAQLLKGAGHNRYEQVTNVSMELKRVCLRRNLVIVLLCQLSRPDKTRTPRKDDGQVRGVEPKMTDLRDSGQIEQDADVILFLQWPLKENAAYSPYHRYFIYVAKNRNRATNATEMQCRIIPSRQELVATNYCEALEEMNDDEGYEERWR